MHLSIIGNHIDCIRKLLDVNANINARTHNGSLPIHLAAYLGNIEIFDLLNNHPQAPKLTETDQKGNVCIFTYVTFKSNFFFQRRFFILLLQQNQTNLIL